MLADVGSHDLIDHEAALGGLAGELFQLVQPAQAYVDALVAELADRTAEPLTDLALASESNLISDLASCRMLLLQGGLLLLPGEQHAHQHCPARDCLQQRGANIVLQLPAVIGELDAVPR
jgi:hypothetical protein